MTTDTTITDHERDMLRFPACADILRRCSPVVNAIARGLPDDAEDVYPNGALTGLVCGVMTGRAIIAWDCCEQWDRVNFAGLALDLTDATGRAHLAWWIHEHHCAWWETASGVCPGSLVASHSLRIYAVGAHYPDSPDTYSWTERDIPALATLDPNDPRRLPDGSRLVDALALSLVGRHLLAGGGR